MAYSKEFKNLKRRRKDIVVSCDPCPREGCKGHLTEPFVINDQRQTAIWCTDCRWWTLGPDVDAK